MSVMFRRALEAHIQQLTDALEQPQALDRTADIQRIEALLQSSHDGRFKRALNNAKKRLQSDVPKTDSADLRRRLDSLRQMFLMIKDHPDYAFRRKSRKGVPGGTGAPRGRPRKNPI